MNPLEKYRPKTLQEYGTGMHVVMAKTYMTKRTKPALLLYGPAGCGKTTLARCLFYGKDYGDMNASDDRSSPAIRAAMDSAMSGIPLILDDPFVHFDDARHVDAARILLEQVLPTHQVFLFSCHELRYKNLLELLGEQLQAKVHPVQPVKVAAAASSGPGAG